MELDGSLADNLRAAIASAKRLRGHRVHADTLNFWRELLSHARAVRRANDGGSTDLDDLVVNLQSALAEHEQS